MSDRETVQGAESRPRRRELVGLGRPRLGHFRHQRDDRVDVRVDLLDATQAGGQQFARRDVATLDQGGQFDCRLVDQLGHTATSILGSAGAVLDPLIRITAAPTTEQPPAAM